MRKNEKKSDNFFILTNVINVSEQHSREFSHWSDILGIANVGNTATFKCIPYNLKITLYTWKVLS